MAPPKLKVTQAELRDRFNRDIQPHITNGLYQLRRAWEYAAPPHQPAGTRAVIFEVLDDNEEMIARCHAYVLPDGSYGASGRLDPKQIRVGNTILYI